MELSFLQYLNSLKQFVRSERASEVFSSTSYKEVFGESFQVPAFNLDICTVNCTTENAGIQWEKAALNPLVSSWSVSFEFSFCGGKTRFTHAIAANKRANSHNFKIKNLNLLTITFLAVYLMNRGKSSYMNESSMRVNNTFRYIIDCFWRKHCRDSPCQTSSVVFQIFFTFFFSYALSNWQVSDCDR